MRFLFIEAFFGGSHRDFAQGWAENSRHEIELLTLPARFWKWRMRGAALWLFHELSPADPPHPVSPLGAYEGLITSNMMSLSDFRMLAGPACPPVLLYFHENQLAYPLQPGESMDLQYGFTDITSALAADRVIFNSRFHSDTFFSRLPGFLHRMPEFRPAWVADAIRRKSGVLYPGCRFPSLGRGEFSDNNPENDMDVTEKNTDPPLIVWNHRWEFDKAPEVFFRALEKVREMGADFRLALIGENYRRIPEVFRTAQKRFGDRIICFGYIQDRNEYTALLRRGNIIISTAIQENFGIAVAEAVRYGCIPLLPNRLSYPEILPEKFHEKCLYADESDLTDKLFRMISDFPQYQKMRKQTAAAMEKFAWENMIGDYDDMLEDMVRQ